MNLSEAPGYLDVVKRPLGKEGSARVLLCGLHMSGRRDRSGNLNPLCAIRFDSPVLSGRRESAGMDGSRSRRKQQKRALAGNNSPYNFHLDAVVYQYAEPACRPVGLPASLLC